MSAPAGTVYASALRRGAPLMARHDDGQMQKLEVDFWLADAGPVDERIVERAIGPVLDVGCGPGRHVHALALRGIPALGLDASPTAVGIATARGAMAILGDVFTHALDVGAWKTVLLLDGNVGIGGDPVALLRRIAELLAADGTVIVETSGPGTGLQSGHVRLEDDDDVSVWFPWARVGEEAIEAVGGVAGLGVIDRWHDDGRWFAQLARL